MLYRILGDLVAIAHAGYVLFVVVGLFVILLGWVLKWNWVRNFWFRLVHLVAIVIVGLEAVLGVTCPLTDLERYLRARGGQETYQGDFLAHWANLLLYNDSIPLWVFTCGHIFFALLVISVFALVPPRRPGYRPAPRS